MKLIVNGDTLSLDGNTIADLVAQLELTGRRLAVEVNRGHHPEKPTCRLHAETKVTCWKSCMPSAAADPQPPELS